MMSGKGKEKSTDEQLRRMGCDFNSLSRCDGSVMYNQGGTSVIAAVLGPIEAKTQSVILANSCLECNYRPVAGLPQVKDRIRETVIKEVLDLAMITDAYPRAKMSLQVQELEDRGSMDAVALNAACLAMIIGGMPLKYCFAAVHCIINEQGEYVLDPDESEMKHQRAGLTFTYDSVDGNLLWTSTKGTVKLAELNDIECICRKASTEIFAFYRKQIAQYHGITENDTDVTMEA